MTTTDDSGPRWTRRAVSPVFDSTDHPDASTPTGFRRTASSAPLERLRALIRTLHAQVDTLGDEELQQGIAIVETSIGELHALAFGREESARMAHDGRALRYIGTRLDDIVRFAIHRLHDVAIQHRIRIRWDASAERAWLCCDEENICSVLVDLIRNALTLTRPGSEIVVRTWCSGTEVGVEIHDDSDGLTPAERAMLSEPLWWPSWTASKAALGLCIAWVVATAHGGHVSVETATGVGTSLWLVLPRGLLH